MNYIHLWFELYFLFFISFKTTDFNKCLYQCSRHHLIVDVRRGNIPTNPFTMLECLKFAVLLILRL